MKTAISISSLMLVLLASAAVPAHAAQVEPTPPFTAEACAASRQALDAMGALLRDAKALGPEKLAFELEPHLDQLSANRPPEANHRAHAGGLVADMRDSIALLRGSPKEAVRELALQRMEQDHVQYGAVLDVAGCPEPVR